MKYTVFFLVALGIFASLWINSDAGVAIDRKTRGSCFFGDTGCSTSCGVHGHLNGGCCGSSGGCDGVCYCKGSGFEHRCHHCDL